MLMERSSSVSSGPWSIDKKEHIAHISHFRSAEPVSLLGAAYK